MRAVRIMSTWYSGDPGFPSTGVDAASSASPTPRSGETDGSAGLELQRSKSFSHNLREALLPVDIGMRVVGGSIFDFET